MPHKRKKDSELKRPRRRRYKPVNEGSLRSISEWFLSPIYRQYREENQSAKSFFDELFDVDGRVIQRWKVRAPFRMPGLLYMGGFVKIQGAGQRYLKRGQLVLTRTDKVNPSHVDVEFFAGQGKRDQCFYLDQSEWELVKLSLELVNEVAKP